jgi:tellurite resistance protein TerC
MSDHRPSNRSASALRRVKRVIILVVGLTVVLMGVALLVLPGPGVLVLAGGLAILGIEFRWARRWLRAVRDMLDKVMNSQHSDPDKR